MYKTLFLHPEIHKKHVFLFCNLLIISPYIHFVRTLPHCIQIPLFYKQIEVIQCFILQKSCNSAIIMTGNERMCLQKSQQTAITLRTAKFRAFRKPYLARST